jgi:hypothetical protein
LRRIVVLPQYVAVVVASEAIDECLWGDVLRAGGYDVVKKPFEKNEVDMLLEFASLRVSLPRSGLTVRCTDRTPSNIPDSLYGSKT